MSSLYVQDQIRAFVAANWTATPIIDAENIFADPPSDLSPWLTMRFDSLPEEAPCLGPRQLVRKRENGSVTLAVYVESGTGNDVALGYAEGVRNMMRGQNIGGIQIWGADPPETAVPSQAQASIGNYYGYSVTCDYQYDHI